MVCFPGPGLRDIQQYNGGRFEAQKHLLPLFALLTCWASFQTMMALHLSSHCGTTFFSRSLPFDVSDLLFINAFGTQRGESDRDWEGALSEL